MANATFRVLYIFMLILEFEFLAQQCLFCLAEERLDNSPDLAAGQQSLENNEGYSSYDETLDEDGVHSNRQALVEKKTSSINEAIKREIQKMTQDTEPSTGGREFYQNVQAQRAAMDAYARTNRKRKRALASSHEETDSSVGVAANAAPVDSQIAEGNLEEKRELPPYLFDSFQKARGALNGRQRSKRFDHEREREHTRLQEDPVAEDAKPVKEKDIDDE